MALNTEIGATLVLDTLSASQAIREVRSHIKTLKDEVGAIDSKMKAYGVTADDLTSILKNLAQQEAEQKNLLAKLTKEYDEATASGGKTVKQLDQMRSNIAQAEKKLNSITLQQQHYNKELDNLNSKGSRTTAFFNTFKQALTDINPTLGKLVSGLGGAKLAFGTLATVAGVEIVKAVKAGVQAFMEYEDAFAGIRKTINGTETDFENINAEIQQLAREIPKSASQIAEMAKLGGQLGIASDDVVDFAEVVLRLADTTNVVAESAGEMIAQIGAITGLDSSDYERFGSTLVALGNSASATEKEILDMSNRIARFSQSAKLSNQEILALATALTSMGIEAEAGGTSLQKMFAKLTLAVETGSEELNGFASVAGMSAEEFSKLYKQSSIKGLQALLKGMNNLDEESQSYTKTLADLDITEVRLSSVMQALASNQDGLTDALSLAQTAWVENSELARSSGEVYDTLSSTIQVAKNNFTELSRNIGAVFAPAISGVVTVASNVAQALNEIGVTNVAVAMDDAQTSIADYKTALEGVKNVTDEASLANMKFAQTLQLNTLTQTLNDNINTWEDLQKTIDETTKVQETATANANIQANSFVSWMQKLDGSISTFDEAQDKFNEMKEAGRDGGTIMNEAQQALDLWNERLYEASTANSTLTEKQNQSNQILEVWAQAVNDGTVKLSYLRAVDEDFAKSVEETALKLQAESEAIKAQAEALKIVEGIITKYKDSMKAGTMTQDEYVSSLEKLKKNLTAEMKLLKEGSDAWNSYKNQIDTVQKAIDEQASIKPKIIVDAESVEVDAEGVAEEIENQIVKQIIDVDGVKIRIYYDEDELKDIENFDPASIIKKYGSEADKTALELEELNYQLEIAEGASKKAGEGSEEHAKAIALLEQAIKDLLNPVEKLKDTDSWVNSFGTEAQKLQVKIDAVTDSIAEMKAELTKEGADTGLLNSLIDQAEAQKKELETEMANIGKDASKSFMEALVPDVDWTKWNAEEWGNYIRDNLLDVASQISDAISSLLDATYQADIDAKKAEITALEEQLDSTMEAMEAQSDEAKSKLEAQYQAGYITEVEYYHKSQKQQAEYEKAKQKAEAETAQKKTQLLKEQQAIEEAQFNANKANSIAQVLIDSAQAIIKGWAQGPVVGATTTALMAGLTAMQIAQINAQRYVPALAQGGITTGPTMALIGDNSSGREAVIPLEQSTMRMLASEILKGMRTQNSTVYNNSSQADDNRTYTINQSITTPRGMTRREAYLQARKALKETR